MTPGAVSVSNPTGTWTMTGDDLRGRELNIGVSHDR
jgi:hypothetical protein